MHARARALPAPTRNARLRSILADFGQTPHGPVEIADIFTHRVTVKRERGLAAFILKGLVRSLDVLNVDPTPVALRLARCETVSVTEFVHAFLETVNPAETQSLIHGFGVG